MSTPYIEAAQQQPYLVEPEPAPDRTTAQRNRHRLIIFAAVFLVSALAGLAYTFMRPAVYQSTATLLLAPTVTPDPTAASTASSGGNREDIDPQYIAVQGQILISQELLSRLHERLTAIGTSPDGLPASVAELSSRLEAIPHADTRMIELRSQGTQRELLPALLTAWIEVYLQTQAADAGNTAESTLTALRQQLQELAPKITAKRRQLEQFRQQYDILSMEGNENLAPTQLKGLQDALNNASEKEADARARLAALRNAIAQGSPVLGEQDQIRIGQLEDQATRLREQLRQFGERFTPKYMELDPDIVAMTRNLEKLESQIAAAQQQGQKLAVTDAERELASVHQTVLDLQQRLTTHKKAALDFTSRFAEHQAMQEELAQLEQIYQQTQTRLEREETAHQYTFPKVTVLSQPTLPGSPLYPHYQRDAGISLAAALLLAVFAVGLYELLHRAPRAAVRTESRSYFYALPQERLNILINPEPLPAPPPLVLAHNLSRELTTAEVERLLEIADQTGRLLIDLLLSGLSLDEITALRWEQVDLAMDILHVPGASARSIPLAGLLEAELVVQAAARPVVSAPVLQTQGRPLTAAEAQALLACLAHDAGLTDPDEVIPEQLRHTYLAFLVRQGLRLTELGRVAGYVPATVLTGYKPLSPSDSNRLLEEIEWVYPALRI